MTEHCYDDITRIPYLMFLMGRTTSETHAAIVQTRKHPLRKAFVNFLYRLQFLFQFRISRYKEIEKQGSMLGDRLASECTCTSVGDSLPNRPDQSHPELY